MKKQILFLALILLYQFGCAPRKHDNPPDAVPAPVPPPSVAKEQAPEIVLSQCDRNKNKYLTRTDLFDEPTTNVTIERDFQRVIRTDCQGAVVSDQIETVRSPRANVILKPSTPLPQDSGLVSLLNSETCDGRAGRLPSYDLFLFGNLFAITGKANGKIKVKMDMAEALLTFKVTTGLNRIFYTYYGICPKKTSFEDCFKNEIRRGVYNVMVNYNEKTLPGETTIQAYDCQK